MLSNYAIEFFREQSKEAVFMFNGEIYFIVNHYFELK
jgi:hypothetical protein